MSKAALDYFSKFPEIMEGTYSQEQIIRLLDGFGDERLEWAAQQCEAHPRLFRTRICMDMAAKEIRAGKSSGGSNG